MTPDLPLAWIATTKPNRDQGLYHLTATLEPSWGGTVVVAACGANPFAYSGCFPESHTKDAD